MLLNNFRRAFVFSTVTKQQVKRSYYNMSAKDLVIKAQEGKHTGTVIFLHGLGDDPTGWGMSFRSVQHRNPHLKFILPCAPIAPVTLNGGMRMTSWHDIISLEEVDQTFTGIEESRKLVEKIIQDEIKSGIPSNRIILGGFSQGAAVSLYTGYQLKLTLGGVVALSGYLPNYTKMPTLVTQEALQTPLLQCHGDRDQVVSLEHGRRAFKVLTEEAKIKGEFKIYKYMQHSSSDAEMKDVEDFIIKQMGSK